MRVLIIDRQPRARQSMTALLDAWNQIGQLREAADVCEALHQLVKIPPEFIFVDARVPDDHGLKAIRSIRTEYPSFTILVFSMNLLVRAEAIAAGADAFINPRDPSEKLRETLRDLFEGRKRNLEKHAQSFAFTKP